jgi:hypothetical protein
MLARKATVLAFGSFEVIVRLILPRFNRVAA